MARSSAGFQNGGGLAVIQSCSRRCLERRVTGILAASAYGMFQDMDSIAGPDGHGPTASDTVGHSARHVGCLTIPGNHGLVVRPPPTQSARAALGGSALQRVSSWIVRCCGQAGEEGAMRCRLSLPEFRERLDRRARSRSRRSRQGSTSAPSIVHVAVLTDFAWAVRSLVRRSEASSNGPSQRPSGSPKRS